MTILRMQREKTDGPVSGSGMDQVVETRGLSTRVKIALGGAAVLFAALGWSNYRGTAEQLCDYFPSSGSGQVNVEFHVNR